jgi:hypothetical protein
MRSDPDAYVGQHMAAILREQEKDRRGLYYAREYVPAVPELILPSLYASRLSPLLDHRHGFPAPSRAYSVAWLPRLSGRVQTRFVGGMIGEVLRWPHAGNLYGSKTYLEGSTASLSI